MHTTRSGSQRRSVREETLDLAKQLIERPSITPNDAGCQEILANRLSRAGFRCSTLKFNDTTNLWAVAGDTGRLLVLAGHTDVVPTGPVDSWHSPPFVPTVRNGLLFGRGSADMKGGLAAMITAAERFLDSGPAMEGRLGFLITSDEEGPAVDGTRAVLEHIYDSGERIDWCLIGEPSSRQRVGDRIRIGRRGSLNASLKILGKQGHIAYPQLAENAIHIALPELDGLTRMQWNDGDSQFSPTQLQISNIQSGTGATNVIPGELSVDFNLRFNPRQTAKGLIREIEAGFTRLNCRWDWKVSGEPFLTQPGLLIDMVCAEIERETSYKPELSTDGGTSDGRFFSPRGVDVVELGPLSETIHQLNECCGVEDLVHLSHIYERVTRRLLVRPN